MPPSRKTKDDLYRFYPYNENVELQKKFLKYVSIAAQVISIMILA